VWQRLFLSLEKRERDGGLTWGRNKEGEGAPGAASNDGGACPTTTRAWCRRAVIGSTMEQGRAGRLTGGPWAQ
jgi:hypothetical protein